MADPRKPKSPCSISGCGRLAQGRGLCKPHYDQWYGKIRRERDKLKKKDKPFLRFINMYRPGSGYHILFEAIRTNPPITTAQIMHRAKIELVKAGKTKYRLDYAFEVIKSKRHACKKGDYQMRQDSKGRWHLIREQRQQHGE